MSNSVDKIKLCCKTAHQRSTPVSLKIYPLHSLLIIEPLTQGSAVQNEISLPQSGGSQLMVWTPKALLNDMNLGSEHKCFILEIYLKSAMKMVHVYISEADPRIFDWGNPNFGSERTVGLFWGKLPLPPHPLPPVAVVGYDSLSAYRLLGFI